MAGWYELNKSSNGKFYFNLKAGNGEKILSSEMYEAKTSAKDGIASVQKNCTDEARYERKNASNGKPMFNLKAANHQVIGTSELYNSESARDNGIESTKTNGTSQTIKDNT